MNYRNTRSAYLNCEKRIFDNCNEYGFPQMQPVDIDLSEPDVIGFNYAIGEKHPENKILHFYLDDYQFMRVWDNPNKYVPVLRRFKAVLAPDFSLYSDFPKVVQMYNHYRKQWCGAYWQENGIKVIPTICWSDESSFEWCFDGVPHNSLICISTVGGFKTKKSKEAWLKGYHKCLEALDPTKILLFGERWEEIELETNKPVEIIMAGSPQIMRFSQIIDRR